MTYLLTKYFYKWISIYIYYIYFRLIVYFISSNKSENASFVSSTPVLLNFGL